MAPQAQQPPKCVKSCSACLAWVRTPEKKLEIETVCRRVRTSVFYQQFQLAEEAKVEAAKQEAVEKAGRVVDGMRIPGFMRKLLDADNSLAGIPAK